jgi:hypothetical protein
MAQVHFSSTEVEKKSLPPLCLLCGAMTEDQITKTFVWYPPWIAVLKLAGYVGLAGYLILGDLLALPSNIHAFVWVTLLLGPSFVLDRFTKSMTVQTPLCAEHLNHWKLSEWFFWLSMGLFVSILGLGGLAILVLGRAVLPWASQIASIVWAGLIIFWLISMIAGEILRHRAIHPTEITTDGIALTKVCPAFAEAWEQEQKMLRQEQRHENKPMSSARKNGNCRHGKD